MRMNLSRPGEDGRRLLTIWRDDNRNRPEHVVIDKHSGLDIVVDVKTEVNVFPYSGKIEEIKEAP